MDKKKFLVIKSTGGAGLGDSIRSVISGIHYALISQRNLVVLWDDGLYGKENYNIFHDLFELSNEFYVTESEKYILENHHKLTTHPIAWKGKLDQPMKYVYGSLISDEWNRQWALNNLSFDQTNFNYSEDILVMWDFDGFPLSWKSLDRNKRLGRSLEETLIKIASKYISPNQTVLEEVEDKTYKRFAERMIGVHIRKTNETGAKEKYISEKTYFQLIDIIRNIYPESGIFLATDNYDVECNFKYRYQNLYTINKWFPKSGEPIHFSCYDSQPLQRAKEALLDILLLASCNFLIYPSSSSFSHISRIFSKLPSYNVYPLISKPNFSSELVNLYKIINSIVSNSIKILR